MNKKEYNTILSLCNAYMVAKAEFIPYIDMKMFDVVVLKDDNSLQVIKNRFTGEIGYVTDNNK